MATTATETLASLTASDVMKPELATVYCGTSLRDAAKLLLKAQVSCAPVVDENERFLGVLTASDLVRWTDGGFREPVVGTPRACHYQTPGRLLTGDEVVVCTLAIGCCPVQKTQPTTTVAHMAVCSSPFDLVADWQQPVPDVSDQVGSLLHETTDAGTASPDTPLADVVRRMVEDRVLRVFVLDERRRPIGVVSTNEILATLLQKESPRKPQSPFGQGMHPDEKELAQGK